MYLRSGWIVVVVVLVTACVLLSSTTPEQRCRKATVKVEVYEDCMAARDCYMTVADRKDYIEAKVKVAEWCEHPLSKGVLQN